MAIEILNWTQPLSLAGERPRTPDRAQPSLSPPAAGNSSNGLPHRTAEEAQVVFKPFENGLPEENAAIGQVRGGQPSLPVCERDCPQF